MRVIMTLCHYVILKKNCHNLRSLLRSIAQAPDLYAHYYFTARIKVWHKRLFPLLLHYIMTLEK